MAAIGKLSECAVAPNVTPNLTIHFATTSDVKMKQYGLIFRELGVELVRAPMIASAFVEPQADANSPDSDLIVVAHPLRLAARFGERLNCIPYMKEHTMLTISALSAAGPHGPGLPGPDTKSWWRNLKAEGVLNLLDGEVDRAATFTFQIGAYVGKGKYCFAQANLPGKISLTVRDSELAKREFPRSNPFFFHSIFEPQDCEITLAEMGFEQFVRHDYRRACAEQFLENLKEFSFDRSRQLRLPLDET